jgi:cell division protein FtsQ
MHALRRILLGLLVMAILASPVVAVLNGWVGGQHWPMKRLQVSAPFHYVTQQQIQGAVKPYLNSGFFAVDLGAINRSLSALHWVERVEVRKKWPDALVVQLQEYRPMAVWNGKQMLAEQGSVFAMPKTALPVLPRFTGQDAQAREMLNFYEKTQPMFRTIGLGISELSLNERRAWRVVLSDGLVLDMGRNDVEPRLSRFISLLPKIRRDDPRRLVHADLRYTNGFALVWQEKPTPEADPVPPQNTQGQAVI